MTYKYLENVENYFDNEAKRIIDIIYDDSSQFGFETQDMLNHIDERIKEYYIHIELRMFGYNEAIKNKEDLSKYDFILEKVVNHYEKYIQYVIDNKKYLNENFVKKLYLYVEKELLNNYVEDLLFKVFKFAKQNIKEHWDTVDCIALIYLLDKMYNSK